MFSDISFVVLICLISFCAICSSCGSNLAMMRSIETSSSMGAIGIAVYDAHNFKGKGLAKFARYPHFSWIRLWITALS